MSAALTPQDHEQATREALARLERTTTRLARRNETTREGWEFMALLRAALAESIAFATAEGGALDVREDCYHVIFASDGDTAEAQDRAMELRDDCILRNLATLAGLGR